MRPSTPKVKSTKGFNINNDKRNKLKQLLSAKLSKKFDIPLTDEFLVREINNLLNKDNINDKDLKNLENKFKLYADRLNDIKNKENYYEGNQAENRSIHSKRSVSQSAHHSARNSQNSNLPNKNNLNFNHQVNFDADQGGVPDSYNQIAQIKGHTPKSIRSKVQDDKNSVMSFKSGSSYLKGREDKDRRFLGIGKKPKFKVTKQDLIDEEERKKALRRHDFSKWGDEWTAIQEYKNRMGKSLANKERIGFKNTQNNLRRTFDGQVGEKQYNKKEEKEKEMKFHEQVLDTVDKLTKQEELEKKLDWEKKMKTKEIRDEQIWDNRIKKKEEQLENEDFDRTLSKQINLFSQNNT